MPFYAPENDVLFCKFSKVCGHSGITDIQDGLFFVLTRARTFKKS
jgi:hypothetical protein